MNEPCKIRFKYELAKLKNLLEYVGEFVCKTKLYKSYSGFFDS